MIPAIPIVALLGAIFEGELEERELNEEIANELSDADLFEAVLNGSSPLGELRFSEAVAIDPRRIDALLQQRVTRVFWRLLEAARSEDELDVLRTLWVQRMAALRQRGQISAELLADDLQASWEGAEDSPGYRDLLTRGIWPMADRGVPEAVSVDEAMVEGQLELARAFREAAWVADRASGYAPSMDARAAWTRMRDVVLAMWATISERIAQLEGEPVQGITIEEIAEAVDVVPNVSFGGFEQYVSSGHRAPWAALPSWRAMGGRYY